MFYLHFFPEEFIKPVYTLLNITTTKGTSLYSAQSFNNVDASFKDKKSMYYPVWNDSNFKQECIMCEPAFFSYPIISLNETISNCQIQFSGQHYSHYISNPEGDKFIYNTFTKVAKNSKSNFIIMEDINLNISIGDYIIDEKGILEKEFLQTFIQSGNKTEINFTLFDISTVLYNNEIEIYKPNNNYNPFIITDKLGKINILTPGSDGVTGILNRQRWRTLGGSGGTNYFTGKIYVDKLTNSEYTIVPLVQVIDIINNNVLITNSNNIDTITEGSFIQTIKLQETLDLAVFQNIDSNIKSTGINSKIRVSEITSGRISNINIIEPGEKYSSENRPMILIDNYYNGKEINIIN